MEPATPSSVMGDSEASGQLGGAEKDAGITVYDFSDVLLASLYSMPKGYVLQSRNRHERRKNRALLRGGMRLPQGVLSV